MNNSYPKAKCVAWHFVLFPNTPLWPRVSRVAAFRRPFNHFMRIRLPFATPAYHTRIDSGNKGQRSRLMLSHIMKPYKTERSSIKLESDDHRRRTQVSLLKLKIPVLYS